MGATGANPTRPETKRPLMDPFDAWLWQATTAPAIAAECDRLRATLQSAHEANSRLAMSLEESRRANDSLRVDKAELRHALIRVVRPYDVDSYPQSFSARWHKARAVIARFAGQPRRPSLGATHSARKQCHFVASIQQTTELDI